MEQLAIFPFPKSAIAERRSGRKRPKASPAAESQTSFGSPSHGVETLLTSREAAQVLKIHPKVLERMAKRGEVPALKVGKFWRYSTAALDDWIRSRLQSERQPCRMKTSF